MMCNLKFVWIVQFQQPKRNVYFHKFTITEEKIKARFYLTKYKCLQWQGFFNTNFLFAPGRSYLCYQLHTQIFFFNALICIQFCLDKQRQIIIFFFLTLSKSLKVQFISKRKNTAYVLKKIVQWSKKSIFVSQIKSFRRKKKLKSARKLAEIIKRNFYEMKN